MPINNLNKISMLIIGGFGNQLFQLAKANELRKLGYNISIDTSDFKRSKSRINPTTIPRELVLPINYFNFKESGILEKTFLNSAYKNNFAKKLFIKIGLIGEINDYNFNKSELKLFNRMVGYWQNPKMLIEQKDFLIESLKNNKELHDGFNKKIIPGSTVVHVRRNDYVYLKEDLKINFYKNSIDYCKKNIENFNFEVFTDDYSWTANQEVFKDAKLIHNDSLTINGTIDTFSKMLNNENYVVGNSTFSLAAALLSENQKSKIIVASPWFRNSNSKLKIKNSWILINNKI